MGRQERRDILCSTIHTLHNTQITHISPKQITPSPHTKTLSVTYTFLSIIFTILYSFPFLLTVRNFLLSTAEMSSADCVDCGVKSRMAQRFD